MRKATPPRPRWRACRRSFNASYLTADAISHLVELLQLDVRDCSEQVGQASPVTFEQDLAQPIDELRLLEQRLGVGALQREVDEVAHGVGEMIG